MITGKMILRVLVWIGVIVFQWIMTQVVTFVVSMLLPSMGGDFENGLPTSIIILLGITFSVGAFLGGWLAIRLRWIKADPKWQARFSWTFVGAYIPLMIALLVYHPVEPGNPFLFGQNLPALLASMCRDGLK